jgi:hypothetical protein
MVRACASVRTDSFTGTHDAKPDSIGYNEDSVPDLESQPAAKFLRRAIHVSR